MPFTIDWWNGPCIIFFMSITKGSHSSGSLQLFGQFLKLLAKRNASGGWMGKRLVGSRFPTLLVGMEAGNNLLAYEQRKQELETSLSDLWGAEGRKLLHKTPYSSQPRGTLERILNLISGQTLIAKLDSIPSLTSLLALIELEHRVAVTQTFLEDRRQFVKLLLEKSSEERANADASHPLWARGLRCGLWAYFALQHEGQADAAAWVARIGHSTRAHVISRPTREETEAFIAAHRPPRRADRRAYHRALQKLLQLEGRNVSLSPLGSITLR